jgi:hypothetical protein
LAALGILNPLVPDLRPAAKLEQAKDRPARWSKITSAASVLAKSVITTSLPTDTYMPKPSRTDAISTWTLYRRRRPGRD